MGSTIQLKRHTTDSTLPSTVLAVGEPFWQKLTNKLYIGDGSTNLTSLSPINPDTVASATNVTTSIGGTAISNIFTGSGTSIKAKKAYGDEDGNSIKTSYAASIEHTTDSTTGDVTINLKNKNNTVLSSTTFSVGGGSVDYAKYLYENSYGIAHDGEYYLNAANFVGSMSPNVSFDNAVLPALYCGKTLISKNSSTSEVEFGSVRTGSINCSEISSSSSITCLSVNGFQLNTNSSGFTLTASSKVLSVNSNYTLSTACTKDVKDSTSPTVLTYTDDDLVTGRAVYYTLPTINGSHNYTSSTYIYAPTSAGTSGQILKSNGSGAPVWTSASNIKAGYIDENLSTPDGEGINTYRYILDTALNTSYIYYVSVVVLASNINYTFNGIINPSQSGSHLIGSDGTVIVRYINSSNNKYITTNNANYTISQIKTMILMK